MFSNPVHITKSKTTSFQDFNDPTYPDIRTDYKVRINEVPFVIRMEQFGENYHFLKFFPKRHITNPDKFRIRFNKIDLKGMNQLLSSCLKIAIDIMNKDPDCMIGFYGQWDKIDVEKESDNSQRYRLWRRIAANKIPETKYEFVFDDNYNFLMLVPKDLCSNKTEKEIQGFFESRFRTKLDDFKIPSKQEYEAKKLDDF